jgi:hypothetical protein
MERYHFAVQFSRCSATARPHDVSFPKPAALGSVLIVVIYSYVSTRRGTCRSHESLMPISAGSDGVSALSHVTI